MTHGRRAGGGAHRPRHGGVGILRDLRDTYGEEFEGHTLTRFDGNRVTI